MGAMHNDLNRCSFMYDHQRRCLNPQETPGATFCYYHARRKEKEQARSDGLTSRALFAWLASHPLDTATQINRALNQLYLCVAGDLISARRADSMVRMARMLLKTVVEVNREARDPFRVDHVQKKDRFQQEIRYLLAVAAAQDAGDSPEPEGPMDPPPAKAAAVAAAA